MNVFLSFLIKIQDHLFINQMTHFTWTDICVECMISNVYWYTFQITYYMNRIQWKYYSWTLKLTKVIWTRPKTHLGIYITRLTRTLSIIAALFLFTHAYLSLNEWSSVHEESPFCPLFSWCFCLTVSLFSTDVSTSLCFVLIINNNTCCIWIDCLYRRSAVLTLSSSDCWFDNISKHISPRIRRRRRRWTNGKNEQALLNNLICIVINAAQIQHMLLYQSKNNEELLLQQTNLEMETQHTTNKIKQ